MWCKFAGFKVFKTMASKVTHIHFERRALCKCATDGSTSGELKPIQMGYYEQMKTLATSGRYDTRDDFTVVHQPFMVNQDFVKNVSLFE